MTLYSPDKSFKAVWNCTKQHYTIFKDGVYIKTVPSIKAVKPYLN